MAIERKLPVVSYDVMTDSTIRPSALFRYYQQVAGEHLDSLGLTYNETRERKCVFVITRMKSVFYKPIKRYDEIVIKTASRGIKGAVFTRDYTVTKGDELVAEASSMWTLIDIESRRICRPSVYADYFTLGEELCSFTDVKKCVFDTPLENEYLYKVVFFDIDENRHMNNTRYPDICLDAIGGLAEGEYIREVSIDFLSEARLSDVLSVRYLKTPDGYLFSAENTSTGKTCFNAEIVIAK